MTDRILEKKSTVGSRKLDTISVDQLEYTAGRIFSYGTLAFAVALGLVSIAYMTVQQLRK